MIDSRGDGVSHGGEQGCLSAVITAYNCADYIAEAIDSVLAQSRVPDEILVVDDGSTDSTGQIVSTYLPKGVRYLYQANQGAGAARNLGIRHTRGEYLAFLDADDLWVENKCRWQVEALRAWPAAGLVTGGAWWWNTDSGTRWQVNGNPRSTTQGRREIVVRNWVGNPSMVMLRRSILEKTGLFDTTLRWGQDWELWTRLVALSEVVILHEPLIVYRSHSANLTHTGHWQRLDSFWSISRRAIAAYRPAWLRPALLARAWSLSCYERADTARVDGRPWIEQVWRAWLALAAYPFEDGLKKAKLLARVVMRESTFQWLRRALRPAAGGVNREEA